MINNKLNLILLQMPTLKIHYTITHHYTLQIYLTTCTFCIILIYQFCQIRYIFTRIRLSSQPKCMICILRIFSKEIQKRIHIIFSCRCIRICEICIIVDWISHSSWWLQKQKKILIILKSITVKKNKCWNYHLRNRNNFLKRSWLLKINSNLKSLSSLINKISWLFRKECKEYKLTTMYLVFTFILKGKDIYLEVFSKISIVTGQVLCQLCLDIDHLLKDMIICNLILYRVIGLSWQFKKSFDIFKYRKIE